MSIEQDFGSDLVVDFAVYLCDRMALFTSINNGRVLFLLGTSDHDALASLKSISVLRVQNIHLFQIQCNTLM